MVPNVKSCPFCQRDDEMVALKARVAALEARQSIVVNPCRPYPWPYSPWDGIVYCGQSNAVQGTATGTLNG